MSDHRPILIAYDGSDFAAAAIDKVAEEFGSREVTVLVVFEELERVPFLATSGVTIEAETMKQLRDAAKAGAEATAAKGAELARAAGLDPTAAVIEGSPIWSAIVDAAEENEAALIVLGSRGLSGIKHVVLGSVSDAVAQHSSRSVFIVHS